MRIIKILLLVCAALPALAQTLVFQGATLVDGTGRPAESNSIVVVEGDHIAAAGAAGQVHYPKNARVIDVRGRTIIPGLINSHGHLGLVVGTTNQADGYTRANVEHALDQYERYGVTAMLSLGLNRDLIYTWRDEQRRGTFSGATVFTAGRGVGVPNGAPPIPVAPDQVYRPNTVEQARAAVQEMAAQHVDVIKLWLDDMYGRYPKMKPEIYRAVVDEAHKRGVRVAAHVFYLADARALVNDGIDILAHSIRDRPVDTEIVQAMKSRGVFYIPTFTVDESSFVLAEQPELMADHFFADAVPEDLRKMFASPEYRKKVASDPNLAKYKAALSTGMRNMKTLQEAGVHVAFGTDSGAMPARIPGWAEHRELELMVRAGLTPMDAIAAATRESAALVGVRDRGTIEAGKRADFVVLAANPLEDIRNTRKMVSVWHNGREVKPAGQ